MDSYGWRIPFLIAGVLGLVGLYIRLRLKDTPEFEELRDSGEVASSPLKEAVTTSWRPILQIAGLVVIHNVGFYIVFTFLPSYFTKTLEFTKTNAFFSITVASLVALVLIPPLGALSDRIGRKPLLIAGAVGFAVFTYPLFLLLNSGSLGAAIAAHAGLAAIEAVFVSASLAAAAELFATRVRSSGYSIGYNVSVALFGGTAPYIATWLVDRTGNVLAPAFYVIAAAIVTLATVFTMRETAAQPLRKLAVARVAPSRDNAVLSSENRVLDSWLGRRRRARLHQGRRGSTEHDHETSTAHASPLRVALASFIGTTVEFYDFLIYGTAAALVFPKLFLCRRVTSGGIAVVVRHFWCRVHCPPLGGMVFGHYGDPHRTQTDAGVLPAPDGRCDRADGAAVHLRADRFGRPNPVDALATRAGLCRRRRLGRRHTHGRRARARATKGDGAYRFWPAPC